MTSLHSLTLELLADTHGDARLRAWQDRFRAAMADSAPAQSLHEWLRDFYNAPRFSSQLDLRIGTHVDWLDATLADIGPPPSEADSLRAALADSQRISAERAEAVEAMGRELEAEREKVAQHVEAMLRYEDGDALRESRAATAKAINERDEARAALAALHAAASEFREAERDYQYGSGNRAARNSRYCTAADGLRDALRDLAPLAAAHDAEVAAMARREALPPGTITHTSGEWDARLREFEAAIATAREEAAASARAGALEEVKRAIDAVRKDGAGDEWWACHSRCWNAVCSLAGSSAKGEAGEACPDRDCDSCFSMQCRGCPLTAEQHAARGAR